MSGGLKMFLAHADVADLERRLDAARVHVRRARRLSTKWEFKAGREVDGLLSDTEKLLDDMLKFLRGP